VNESINDDPIRHREIRFERWEELKAYITQSFINRHSMDWVFRGHSSKGYRLESTLDRLPTRYQKDTAEQYLLYQFQKAAHHYLDYAALPQTTLEWLALMQHHGAPTRLLDFTRSPYVASFFAVESHRGTDWRVIWCIDSGWLRKQALDRIRNAVVQYATLKDFHLQDAAYVARHFRTLFSSHSVGMVLPLEPPRSNERLLVQQGAFCVREQ
jgi:hypothetical protein